MNDPWIASWQGRIFFSWQLDKKEMESELRALAAEREARLRSRGMDPAATEVASEKVGVACPPICSQHAIQQKIACASLCLTSQRECQVAANPWGGERSRQPARAARTGPPLSNAHRSIRMAHSVGLVVFVLCGLLLLCPWVLRTKVLLLCIMAGAAHLARAGGTWLHNTLLPPLLQEGSAPSQQEVANVDKSLFTPRLTTEAWNEEWAVALENLAWCLHTLRHTAALHDAEAKVSCIPATAVQVLYLRQAELHHVSHLFSNRALVARQDRAHHVGQAFSRHLAMRLSTCGCCRHRAPGGSAMFAGALEYLCSQRV